MSIVPEFTSQDKIAVVELAKEYFRNIPKNTEFILDEQVPKISETMGISQEIVFHILSRPPVQMYPEVAERIVQIGESGAFPIILTQGNLGTYDMRQEMKDPYAIGFQPLKIIASGLETVMLPYADRVYEAGLSPVMGGANKLSPQILQRIFSLAMRNGIHDIIAADDMGENLETLGNSVNSFGYSNGLTFRPYWVNRKDDPYPRTYPLLHRARSLTEIPIIPGALYLLDLDRTMIDTDSMKIALCQQFAQPSFN